MSKTNTSQPQQEKASAAPGFDPIIPLVLSLDAWSRLAQENIGRAQSFYDELASFESASYERAKKTANEMADLVSDSIAYASKLAAEWRALTIEATRRGAAALGASA
jgi:hypothetical protein